MSITNDNGAAITLGHALNSSGSHLLATVVYEIQRRTAEGQGIHYGFASCVAQDETTIIERL